MTKIEEEEEEEEEEEGEEDLEDMKQYRESHYELEKVYAVYLHEVTDERATTPEIWHQMESLGVVKREEDSSSESSTKSCDAYRGDRAEVDRETSVGQDSVSNHQSSELDGWYLWDAG
jgi:hypothetical protein